tara:strand:- start:122 stop:292 length:171 start_codon:yes stop_codon:yes gene_type:complete
MVYLQQMPMARAVIGLVGASYLFFVFYETFEALPAPFILLLISLALANEKKVSCCE